MRWMSMNEAQSDLDYNGQFHSADEADDDVETISDNGVEVQVRKASTQVEQAENLIRHGLRENPDQITPFERSLAVLILDLRRKIA